jgi:hypothetical protein
MLNVFALLAHAQRMDMTDDLLNDRKQQIALPLQSCKMLPRHCW